MIRMRLPIAALLGVLLAPLLLAADARAQDSTAARAQDSTQVTHDVPMDRIVAVVGTTPILWSEVLEVINQRRAQGMQVPEDSAAGTWTSAKSSRC